MHKKTSQLAPLSKHVLVCLSIYLSACMGERGRGRGRASLQVGSRLRWLRLAGFAAHGSGSETGSVEENQSVANLHDSPFSSCFAVQWCCFVLGCTGVLSPRLEPKAAHLSSWSLPRSGQLPHLRPLKSRPIRSSSLTIWSPTPKTRVMQVLAGISEATADPLEHRLCYQGGPLRICGVAW